MKPTKYPIYLRWSDEDRAWIAEVPDLPGCMADGPTENEAISAAKVAAQLWIEVAGADGREIPKPTNDTEVASGKFVVRIPKSLHRKLQLMAKREDVSLNQFVLSLLSAHEAVRAIKEEGKAKPVRQRKAG